jgi:hypothetical protein
VDRLTIHLRDDETAFLPGGEVQGTVRWRLDASSRHLELALFWYTAGKGTRDVGVVETLKFSDQATLGSKDFKFTLPRGPYSFSGRLISLIWALELTCMPDSETVRREIIVSPTGREIVLDTVSGVRAAGSDNLRAGGRLAALLRRR